MSQARARVYYLLCTLLILLCRTLAPIHHISLSRIRLLSLVSPLVCPDSHRFRVSLALPAMPLTLRFPYLLTTFSVVATGSLILKIYTLVTEWIIVIPPLSLRDFPGSLAHSRALEG
ncbi:hypothetical protein EDB89DRAFT_755023 [Lactarius sanguifluus]|nr:hypothetical protein EDB89DRAFT_755023 [Lactarius sanguifluus]